MLMYALYTVLGAPYDFSITDMPALRKWWCVMLMENFDLGSCGKVFAHWTDAAKALLRGEAPPVFRLKKRKLDDAAEDQEPQPQPLQITSPLQKDAQTEGEATSIEDKILQDCTKAAEWVQDNPHLFAATVEMPDILQMGQEMQKEFVKQLLSLSSDGSSQLCEDDKEQILEPFKFTFQVVEDMWMFCEEIMDKRQYRAYCECRIEDQ
ncbi:uncharacterized protein LOC115385770 [Salarias fasciatus]|uniref:uncharacterized protein LOC115385770 n=1 Tax=Salarias fasciatus TaxID=181472 RepID=UPI001176B688|nr:uncharacterized protein LOC115385770 [Salarias fasciatus]